MVLFFASAALASPLNPWGSATPEGAAVLNPYVYVYPDAVNPIVYGSVGLNDRIDLFFGYGQYIPTGAAFNASSVGTLEVFPRFFVAPQLALAPHVYWTPGVDGVIAAPEAHLNLAAGPFSFIANAGWRPVISSTGFSAGTVPVSLAPELKLGSWLSAYVEVDPTFSLVDDPVSLLVVPGFGVTLDPKARHTASVGLQIPVLPNDAPASLGFWYAYTHPAPK